MISLKDLVKEIEAGMTRRRVAEMRKLMKRDRKRWNQGKISFSIAPLQPLPDGRIAEGPVQTISSSKRLSKKGRKRYIRDHQRRLSYQKAQPKSSP